MIRSAALRGFQAVAIVTFNVFVACRTDPPTPALAQTQTPTPTLTPTQTQTLTPTRDADATDLIASRPYRLDLPAAADASAIPLVILLHGYGSTGAGHEIYFGLSRLTKARGAALAIPDGTRDHTGKEFWNASDACCDFDADKSSVDDVAYLDALIDDASKRAHIDPARVTIIGHSNGAFMAHRYACERPSRVAAIVALAGVPAAGAKCEARGVSVLQVHGDADRVIDFAGGSSFGNGKPYPSAESAVAMWAQRDGCGASRKPAGPALDLDHASAGAETTRESYECPHGVDVALWRMHGSGHVPSFDAKFSEAALDFLLTHHK